MIRVCIAFQTLSTDSTCQRIKKKEAVTTCEFFVFEFFLRSCSNVNFRSSQHCDTADSRQTHNIGVVAIGFHYFITKTFGWFKCRRTLAFGLVLLLLSCAALCERGFPKGSVFDRCYIIIR